MEVPNDQHEKTLVFVKVYKIDFRYLCCLLLIAMVMIVTFRSESPILIQMTPVAAPSAWKTFKKSLISMAQPSGNDNFMIIGSDEQEKAATFSPDETEIFEETFQERRNIAAESCGLLEISSILKEEDDEFRSITYFDDELRVMLCLLPGIADIGWKKVLLYLNRDLKMREAALDVEDFADSFLNSNIAGHLLRPLSSLYNETDIDIRIRTYTKIMWVQNPFNRLSTNENAMKKLAPYHRLCKVCTTDYHYIGRLENTPREADYIINKVILQTTQTQLVSFPATVEASASAHRDDILPKDFSNYRTITEDAQIFGYF